jgi:hypothetical protein
METSKIQTLDAVHAAIESVEEARSKSLTTKEELALEQTSLILSNIEQALIGKIEDDVVSKLTSDSKKLMALSMQIEKSVKSLESVSKLINKVASAIDVLVKAMSLGDKIL